jgi:hypothetical protein
MPNVIALKEVIDAIDDQSDTSSAYLDPDTGEIITFDDDLQTMAESDHPEDLPDWMRDLAPKIRAALDGDHYLALPDKLDVHDWGIMQRFSERQKREGMRTELLNAIHGAGAFRRFRLTVQQLGLDQSWQKFRNAEIERIAREWLDEHHLKYE